MKLLDLGLPSGTLWADSNLGASQPHELGAHIAWGDKTEKHNYVGKTCETYDLDIIRLKFEDFVSSSNILASSYDAAYQMMGPNWSIPSGIQAQELIDNCNWEWVENFEGTSVCGMLGKSKINGTRIFLPAAGYRHNSDLIMAGKCGGYWTSSPNLQAANRAWSIAFEENVINVFNHGLRYYGYSIRPVTTEPNL